MRPQREQLKSTGADVDHRRYWWRFANTRRELREQVVVFPLPNATAFAVLQSRLHRVWVELQATHMGEGLRYSGGDCFAPFPFPNGDPGAVVPILEAVGVALYADRSRFMRDRGLGMTQTYNLLVDPDRNDADIEFLRRRHEELDRAVLEAYSWADVTVPAYQGASMAEFADVVAGRLFVLNAQRASSSVRLDGPGVRRARGAKGPGTRKVTEETALAKKKQKAK